MTDPGVDLEGLEVRGDPVRYLVEFDQDAVTPSAAVVAALATVSDVDPTEMAPLYDSVDPDALDDVLGSQRREDRPISVTVDVGVYEVSVSNDGVVEIEPPETVPLDGRPNLVSAE